MNIYHGRSISDSIAMGQIYLFKTRQFHIEKEIVSDTDQQINRFDEARAQASQQIDNLVELAQKHASLETAKIFDAHKIMLADPDFLDHVWGVIRSQQTTAEYAVLDAKQYFSTLFSALDDAYMKERATDICDISDRLLSILTGSKSALEPMQTDHAIFVADELLPSEAMQLDHSQIAAFVIQNGSETSHTAILARTLGIPALFGITPQADWDGKQAAVDGAEGALILEPDEQTMTALKQKQKEQHTYLESLETLKGRETRSLDGTKIRLYANITTPADADTAIEKDAEGIGLFRSEFLYLQSDDLPSEEEQLAAYRSVLERMENRTVIIRTMDIGADKIPSYFPSEAEANPAMGLRGIRLSLLREDLFQTQLRALLRSSVYGQLCILFPMITSVAEIKQIKKILNQVKESLISEKIPFHDVPIGIMIETPAAVMISDLLAKEVDFFSIGTNDLAQYTLAIDRQNPNLDTFFDPHHEAITRMLKLVIENGHKEGIWVGICGELAADLDMTEALLSMQVDELSVSPSSILPLRKKIREIFVQK